MCKAVGIDSGYSSHRNVTYHYYAYYELPQVYSDRLKDWASNSEFHDTKVVFSITELRINFSMLMHTIRSFKIL